MSPTPGRLCPKCGGEVREGWRVCPACAAPLDAETRTIFQESSSSTIEEGRFPAGTVLAGRYRILGLLGRGGMGEVYRAYDLILNQAVALKFLPQAQMSEPALARFRNEVRIARQVSHPNVCRVYDIGFVEGLHFISMEYLDGEDLGSLLRRIGRLSQDKAIEFTRKICAGLSAAHERGVLHRDLKPSNIMIDGRGHVRITDFGLAALAQEIALGDIRSGTPAYMSPEQKAGREVTVRSDIYSLGLVLYEMFTGKTRSETSPSEHIKDLDPAIDRVILRCLEEDPKRRPSSALNVAMALPGGDPIAAALAAGETPSPEMVAASMEKEGFSVRTAAMCFAAIVVLVAAGIVIQSKYGLLARAPLKLPPDAMADRAQQLLTLLGYTDHLDYIDYGFDCCEQAAVDNVNRYDSARRAEILASHKPPIITFYYRWSRDRSSVRNPTLNFPDSTDFFRRLLAGVRLLMNADGQLVRLEAEPFNASPINRPVNWDTLFSAAGLDRARFTETKPESTPPMVVDGRQAWTGTYADSRTERVRVEAASWQGRPVMFEVRAFPPAPPGTGAAGFVAVIVLVMLLAAVGGITAWRNLRLGRSDRRGAMVIAGTVFLLGFGAWTLGPSHTTSPMEGHSFVGLFGALGQLSLVAGVMWAFYLAIEPYARRHWPDSLISWTRFCSGKLNNTLVASHILAGIVAASGFFAGISGLAAGLWIRQQIDSIGSASQLAGAWFQRGQNGFLLALALLLMVVLLRLLLQNVWIADLGAAVLLVIVVSTLSGGISAQAAPFFTITSLVWMWVLRRFGFLAMIAIFFFGIQSQLPVTTSGWFAAPSLAEHLIPVGVAAWALWVILSAQRRPATESAA